MSYFFDSAPFQAFVEMAMELDRDRLETLIRLSDSDLGRAIMEAIVEKLFPENKTQMTLTWEKGVAMLKLTAFYLDQLHELFPDQGNQREAPKGG